MRLEPHKNSPTAPSGAGVSTVIFSKSLFASKTFWINLLSGIVTVSGEASGIIPPAWSPYIAAAVGVANILLRLISNGPVHVTTPQVVEQTSASAPLIKSANPQAGFIRIGLLLGIAIGALCWLAGCAATPSTSASLATVAYSAEQTATLALVTVHNLHLSGSISIQQEKQVIDAAQAVQAAAVALQICASSAAATCSSTLLDSAVAQMSAIIPTPAAK